MSNEPSDASFPASQRDLSQLKQTATDAATDLGKTASSHAEKAKGQFKNLANDVQSEGSEQFNKARARFGDVLNSARDYALERPLACLGVALVVGLLIGRSRCSSRD